MKELLRFSHVQTEVYSGARLADFNLTVFAGETVCLLGIHGSGKHAVQRILQGHSEPTGGRLFVDEAAVYPKGTRFFQKKGIHFVSGALSLVGSMPLHENLFLLRPKRRGRVLYGAGPARLETARILREYGITAGLDARTDTLGNFEQYLLSIAKAASMGARLLVLDMVATSFSLQELERLGGQIERLKGRGLSFLLVQDVPDTLTGRASRVVIVHDGRDVKTLYHGRHNYTDLTWYLTGIPTHRDTAPPPASPEESNQLIGYYDPIDASSRPLDVRFCATAAGMGGAFDAGMLKRAVLVPEMSGALLMDELTAEDNLSVPIFRRVGTPAGIVRPKISRYVYRLFLQQFGIEGEPRQVEALSKVERKLLSLYRWAMAKPPCCLRKTPTTASTCRSSSGSLPTCAP